MEKFLEALGDLGNVELNESQIEALDKFFSSLTTDIRKEADQEIKALQEQVEELQEKQGLLTEENVEKAFALFQKDAEKAFELFKEDAEKAATLMVEDVKEEFTHNFAEALEKVYSDVEGRVSSDFTKSKEMKALSQIVEAVNMLGLQPDETSLLEEIETLKSELAEIKGEKEKLSKQQIITSLVSDLPEKYRDTVSNFVEEAEDEEGIYKRFNSIVELIEKGALDKTVAVEETKTNFKKKVTTESKLALVEKEQPAKPFFESETKAEPKKKDDDQDELLNWINLSSFSAI